MTYIAGGVGGVLANPAIEALLEHAGFTDAAVTMVEMHDWSTGQRPEHSMVVMT